MQEYVWLLWMRQNSCFIVPREAASFSVADCIVFSMLGPTTCSRSALLAILRLYPHSLGLLAPVYSSFSFMCSSQAQRYWFSPLGNEDCQAVKLGNVMASRCTLLCWLLVALEHVFILEQPGSAKFGDMPRWQAFCANIAYVSLQKLVYFTQQRLFCLAFLCLRGVVFPPAAHEVFRQQIMMRHFGVHSVKPTCLWANTWKVQFLDDGPLSEEQKKKSEPLAVTYRDGEGKPRCTGKRKELKESQ